MFDWKKMGLTKESIFDPDKALPYWMQYSPSDFIVAIVSELRQEALILKGWTEVIRDTPVVASVEVPGFGEGMTIKQACELVLRRAERLSDMLDLALAYARTASDSTNSKSTD